MKSRPLSNKLVLGQQDLKQSLFTDVIVAHDQ